jgi:MoaA/NifB/PqqE/SkfB family radical SAM enzyme
MNLLGKIKSIIRSDNSSRHLEQSEVFCMAPWIQLHAQTNGEVSPCCMAAYKGDTIGDLRKNSDLSHAWNSDSMKQLRLNMLAEKKSVMCSNCYTHEALGKFSDRQQYNRDYKNDYSRVTATLPDGTVTDLTIPVIDIRFSNKCNYKCRICNSGSSTQLYEEELKLGYIDAGTSKESRAAGNDEVFWESYRKFLHGVKRLHFAGGESLLMEEHYRALNYLIEIGNTDVNLSYNTNFSTLRYKQNNVIELWNKFRKVDVWASLDGMGAQGDYQRKGQRWGEIEENIRTLQRDCPTALFGIDVTVSIFNILHIPQFYEYMVQNKLVDAGRMNLYYLQGPEYFSVTNLTPALKQKAVELYVAFQNGCLQKTTGAEKMKEHAAALIKYMLSKQDKHQMEFTRRIAGIDELRKENFATVFPELNEMMTR